MCKYSLLYASALKIYEHNNMRLIKVLQINIL